MKRSKEFLGTILLMAAIAMICGTQLSDSFLGVQQVFADVKPCIMCTELGCDGGGAKCATYKCRDVDITCYTPIKLPPPGPAPAPPPGPKPV
jgi:hypothetical protein